MSGEGPRPGSAVVGTSIASMPIRFEDYELDRPSLEDLGSCPDYLDLLNAIASCSPFLRGLIETDSDWVIGLANSCPHAVLDDICTPLADMKPIEVASELRRRKRRISLLAGIADLGGIWDLDSVTRALTRFADFSTDCLLRSLVQDAVRRKKIKTESHADADDFSGLFVLAMGKMGAFELNYSSDIDLIILFDESMFSFDETQYAKAEFIRLTRKFMRYMSTSADGGYVFRTDLRLRPDPFVNPVCMSAGGAARYYESFARTWERAAFIKARTCAGDMDAGGRFLQEINPFIWRMLLDFAAVKDTADLKLRISDNKGTGDLTDLMGHDLKLGQGGIRQIELFVQTFQMIAGGRDRSLRIPATLDAMAALTTAGWVNTEARESLTESYRFLRNTEHRLQMVRDTQTHSLPRTETEMDRIAAMSGYTDTGEFITRLREVMSQVDYHTAAAYGSDNSSSAASNEYDFLTDHDTELMESWERLPAFRTDRAVKLFDNLKPVLLSRLSLAKNPHEALSHFDRFLRGLPAGVQLFSLFEANPRLVELLVDTCTTAPRVAEHLGRTSHVFDEVLYSSFFQPFDALDEMCRQLDDELEDVHDYENILRTVRRWLNAQNFRLGIHHLKHMIEYKEASRVYSLLADAVLQCLWPRVVTEFSRRYGPPPGRGATVLAMGSLGARTMTATSDIDLIVIYDPLDQDYSDGPRQLSSRQYYARLTQTFVSAISSPLGEGVLYSIDMRLRPSGQKGPVAASLDSFFNYQRNDAWTWEHLALTRARPVCGTASIGNEVEDFRKKLLAQERDTSEILGDVQKMRQKLSDHLSSSVDNDRWELKKGRGRMLDVELLSQTGALLSGSSGRTVSEQLRSASDHGFITQVDFDRLQNGYSMLSCVLQAARLVLEGRFDLDETGDGVRDFILQQSGQNSVAGLGDRLRSDRMEMAGIIDQRLAWE